MYNSWSRSTLRAPGNLEASLISAPPYHSSSFTSALLVICSSRLQRRAVVYDISAIEPQVATTLELAAPSDAVLDIAWGPDGKFYLLRRPNEDETWRIEGYQLDVSNASEWIIRPLSSTLTSPKFNISSFAVQSRLGGLILGSTVGDLYHRDATGGEPRRIGRWCQDAIAITKVKRDRLIACISKKGKLSIALASLSTPQILELCPENIVSTVSFSHELPTLAVGLADSPPRVRLFEYGWESNRVVATPTRDLVVFGPSLVEEERWLGGVRDLDFGTGSSVSCLFHGRTEPVVFHATSGRRTTSGSANQRLNIGSPSPSLLGSSPSFSPRSLPVGARNHTLTWAGPSLFFLNDQNELCREGFARHASQAALYRNDSVRFAVLGVDYCSILNLEGNPRWTRFDCPPEYVARHGPLTKVSIDDDRSRIAVAGRRGLCVFFAQSRKWKTFQNETLENRLNVQGLFFMPTGHLGLIAQTANNEWEMQALNLSDRRLDVPPSYRSGPLVHGSPICVDFLKTRSRTDMFVLYMNGIMVYQLSSNAEDGAKLNGASNGDVMNGNHGGEEIFDVRALAFITRPPSAELGFVISMVLVPSKLESVLPRCVVVDSAGRAVLLNLETQESASLAPSFRVADAWTKTDPTLGTVVWTVIDRGLKLWVPSLDPSGELYQSSVVDVSFPEVGALPVGSDEDAFICFQSHLYDVRGSKSPVLHGILGWLLRRGRDGLARRVLAERRFSKSVRLVRAALEDLLQGALLGENQVDVRRVVNLLGCVPFEVMAAVVARCARQIDTQLWDVLFSIVGAPRDLFEQCLVRFDTAPPTTRRSELILIAAELLPIVDADKDDPAEGPAIRAKLVLRRCERGSTLEKEVTSYADKRGLDLSVIPEDETFSFTSGQSEASSEGLMSSVIRFLGGS